MKIVPDNKVQSFVISRFNNIFNNLDIYYRNEIIDSEVIQDCLKKQKADFTMDLFLLTSDNRIKYDIILEINESIGKINLSLSGSNIISDYILKGIEHNVFNMHTELLNKPLEPIILNLGYKNG